VSRPIREGGGLFGRLLLDIDCPVGAHALPQCHVLFKVGGDDNMFEVNDRC
jgi:hypothetical protein